MFAFPFAAVCEPAKHCELDVTLLAFYVEKLK